MWVLIWFCFQKRLSITKFAKQNAIIQIMNCYYPCSYGIYMFPFMFHDARNPNTTRFASMIYMNFGMKSVNIYWCFIPFRGKDATGAHGGHNWTRKDPVRLYKCYYTLWCHGDTGPQWARVNPMKEIKFTLVGTANHDGVGDRSKRGFFAPWAQFCAFGNVLFYNYG